MRTSISTNHQVMQRVKVGLVGLAAVILLIGLASAVFSAANRERAAEAAAAAKTEVAVNPVVANTATPADAAKEPLAELGVAPTTAEANATSPDAAR
jgi:cobalamin synthase